MKLFTLKRILILFLIGIGMICSIPLFVKNKVRNQIFVKSENIDEKDFAIVLGAGIRNNQPSLFLKSRLDDAVSLYKSNKVKKILVSGDNGNKRYDEISVMNNYLLKNGVPQNVIYGDYAGFDTYSSIERATKIFDIKSAVIVSQGFHLPRSVYIARQKGIDATGFASHPSLGKKRYFTREYFATIKSFFDCLINRNPKFYGKKINTATGSNININQLK